MSRLLVFSTLVSCAGVLPSGEAPSCPARPPMPFDTVCPDGTEPTHQGAVRACVDTLGNRHGPWLEVRDEAVVGWGWDEHGRAARSSLRGGAGPSWTVQDHDPSGGHSVRLQCWEGRLTARVTPSREQRWDRDGQPILDVVLDDGVEQRRRVWRDGVLRADVSRDGAGWRRSPEGVVVWEASMTAGHPTGEIVGRWPDGSDRMRLRREVVDPQALEPVVTLAAWSHDHDEGRHRGGWAARQLCDERVEGLPPWTRWVPPPGLACEGEAVLWDEAGTVVSEGRYEDGLREGLVRTATTPGRVQVERFEGGRRVLVYTEGVARTGVVTWWDGPTPVASERVDHVADGPDPGTPEERTEAGEELTATGRVLVDRRGGAHRDGTWEVSTLDGVPVRTEHWVDGRLGDVVLHARRVQIPRPAHGRIGRSYQDVIDPIFGWSPLEDEALPATAAPVEGLPVPDVPARWEDLVRLADAVDGAGPDDADLMRWCWDGLADVQSGGFRLGDHRDAPAVARGAPGIEPAAVLDVLRRRTAAAPDGVGPPLGRRACLGDVEVMLRGGPAWVALAAERVASDRGNGWLEPRSAWVRSAATQHRWNAEPTPGWDAALGDGLRDAAWSPWLRGWMGRPAGPDDAVAPAHASTLPLGGDTLVFVTVPCAETTCTVVGLDRVVGASGPVSLQQRRVDFVWAPIGPILDVAAVDDDTVLLTWEEEGRVVSRRLRVHVGRAPRGCPARARHPAGSFDAAFVGEDGLPLCGGEE